MTRASTATRRALFPALALGLGTLALLALEGALRLTGIGDDPPLFVDAVGMPGRLQANPQVVRRYFDRAPALQISPIPFERVKAPGTLRLVVQGGSTAAGFPYGRWGSLAGMLGDRLETSFPERNFEVISTAMAAVNTYTLLDFVEEIIAIQPDAVLVYAGHNEYLGLLGAGSAMTTSSSRATKLLQLRLRGLHLFQLVRASVARSRAIIGTAPSSEADDQALISRAARAAPIAPGSKTAARGLEQFEGNLDWILSRYSEVGIPVFVGTLASNEGSLPPFAGGCSDANRAALHAAGQTRAQAGGNAAAREALEQILAADHDCADAWYALGSLERSAGRPADARAAFREARDRDRLPFRAPTHFNDVIRSVARVNDATVVDVEASLSAASPDGILGEELLLEHVHPNARGYFLLADAFFAALQQAEMIPRGAGIPTRAQAAADMPITVIDRLLADHALQELRAAYPFSEETRKVPFPQPRGPIEVLAQRYHAEKIDWLNAMEELLGIHRRAGRLRAATRVARIAAQAYPTEAAPNFTVGILYLQARQPRRALRYLDRARVANPHDEATLGALVRANWAAGNLTKARTRFAELQRVAPASPTTRGIEKFLRKARPAKRDAQSAAGHDARPGAQ